jgi:hypothetical protein
VAASRLAGGLGEYIELQKMAALSPNFAILLIGNGKRTSRGSVEDEQWLRKFLKVFESMETTSFRNMQTAMTCSRLSVRKQDGSLRRMAPFVGW